MSIVVKHTLIHAIDGDKTCCDVDVRCSKYEASGLAHVELQLVADARRVDREARHVVVAGAERVRPVVYDVAGPRDEVANGAHLASQAYE